MRQLMLGCRDCAIAAFVHTLLLSVPAFCQSGTGTHLDAPHQVVVNPVMFEGYGPGEKIKPEQRDAFTALFSSMMEGDPPRYLSCHYANSRGEPVTWFGFWKDSPPNNIEEMLTMVEPNHPLQAIGMHALSACPQTMAEASAVSGDKGVVAAEVGSTGGETPTVGDTEVAEELAKGLIILLEKTIQNSESPPTFQGNDGANDAAPACGKEFQISPSRMPCGSRWQPIGIWPAELWCYTDFSFQVNGYPGATFCTNGSGGPRAMTNMFNRCKGAEGWCNQ